MEESNITNKNDEVVVPNVVVNETTLGEAEEILPSTDVVDITPAVVEEGKE